MSEMRKLLLVTMMVTVPFLLSCSDTADEMDDLAKAQQCLDRVSQSDPASASNCLSYVEKYSSQQANILKCSIILTSGGLMENKVVQAAEAMEDAGVTNPEAAFMSILSLDVPTINDGYNKAVQGNEFCQASGVAGLQYIGGLVVAGSYMRKTMASLAITLDPANPEAAVSQLIDTCTTTPASCAADIEVLGATVVTLAESYCAGDTADDDVCGDINAAIASSGADTSDIGRALFCFMETPSKNYDPVGDVCIP
jgi:hypothetical protein